MMEVDWEDTQCDLEEIDRRSLQELVKKYKVRANASIAFIILELNKIFDTYRKQSPQTSPESESTASPVSSDDSNNNFKETPQVQKKVAFSFESLAKSARKETEEPSSLFQKSSRGSSSSSLSVNLNDAAFNRRDLNLIDESDEDNEDEKATLGREDDTEQHTAGSVELNPSPRARSRLRFDLSDSDNDEDDDAEEGADDIQGIANQMQRVSLEPVDLDGDATTVDEVERFHQVEKLTEVELEFAPGKLGFWVAKNADQDTVVHGVKPSCRMRDYILTNDILLKIDDFSARKASLEKVKKLLLDGHLGNRLITFGRPTARIPARRRTRRHGTSTSVGADTTARNHSATAAMADEEAPTAPSMLDEDGKVVKQHAEKERKQATYTTPRIKAGEYAMKFSHFKSAEAEKSKCSLLNCFFDYNNKVTPVPVISKWDTSNWPRILPFLMIKDPYKPTNPKGGQRGFSVKQFQTPINIVLNAGSKERMEESKSLMRRLVMMDFKSDQFFKITESITTETCMTTLNGANRSKSTAQQDGTPKHDAINRNNNDNDNGIVPGLTPACHN